MEIKITNCSVNCSGKIRKNQNVKIVVRDNIFSDISKHDFVCNLSYNYQRIGYRVFKTTQNSKVIVPEEQMTHEQRLLFERKAKTKTLLNNIGKQRTLNGRNS